MSKKNQTEEDDLVTHLNKIIIIHTILGILYFKYTDRIINDEE